METMQIVTWVRPRRKARRLNGWPRGLFDTCPKCGSVRQVLAFWLYRDTPEYKTLRLTRFCSDCGAMEILPAGPVFLAVEAPGWLR